MEEYFSTAGIELRVLGHQLVSDVFDRGRAVDREALFSDLHTLAG